MSFLIAAPEMLTAAAADIATIGSTISAADAIAAAPTTSVLAAAADEVSLAIAACSARTPSGIRHSACKRRRSMSNSCAPLPPVASPMRAPRPPMHHRWSSCWTP